MHLRILCLHGMGVDASVFQAQTSSFRSLLPGNYQFTFVDGPVFCEPSLGAAEFYNGPYRCWYNTPTRTKVERCHRQMLEYLDNEGGFDLVMGFSQGAALAASLLLHHQEEYPDAAALFKGAIFICSPLPFSRSLDYGIDVRSHFGINSDHKTSRPTDVPSYLVADKYFLRNDKDLSDSEGSSLSSSPGGRTNKISTISAGFQADKLERALGEADVGGPFYNLFHPGVDSARIRIPTGHVYGARDSWRRHSMDLIGLCDSEAGIYSFEHDGGHEIPRHASEEICDLFEDVVMRATMR